MTDQRFRTETQTSRVASRLVGGKTSATCPYCNTVNFRWLRAYAQTKTVRCRHFSYEYAGTYHFSRLLFRCEAEAETTYLDSGDQVDLSCECPGCHETFEAESFRSYSTRYDPGDGSERIKHRCDHFTSIDWIGEVVTFDITNAKER